MLIDSLKHFIVVGFAVLVFCHLLLLFSLSLGMFFENNENFLSMLR